jgi:hypothetical protein
MADLHSLFRRNIISMTLLTGMQRETPHLQFGPFSRFGRDRPCERIDKTMIFSTRRSTAGDETQVPFLMSCLMSGLTRWVLTPLLCMSMSFGSAMAELTRSDYEACQTNDESAFRSAIESLTIAALNRELSQIDYTDLVSRAWLRLEMDGLINGLVDKAEQEVRSETSWGSLISSLANQEEAEKLATAVAERVYRSDEMRKAIENLVQSVGERVGKHIKLTEDETTGPALACLKAFVGPRYGAMISTAVTTDAGSGLGVDATGAASSVGSGSVLKDSGAGITGVAILVLRRQMGRMAGRLGQRVAGAVLSRLVSVVAGGVGLVLIAKDVWDLRHGVLPIIAQEMKSEDTKQKVREEIAKTLSGHIEDHARQIGATTAQQIVEVWQDFRRAHARALDLADRNTPFRRFLDDLQPSQLPRLDEVVAILLSEGGEGLILSRLSDGTLEHAVKTLPDDAMTIARETRSVEAAIQWHAVSGDALDKVVAYDIYRRGDPAAFTRTSLKRVLALDDRLAISRVAHLSAPARERLFELETEKVKQLARNLTASELATLASYLTGLAPEPQKKILAAIAEQPGRLQIFNSKAVRNAVIASQDQTAAVDMLLRQDRASVANIRADVQLAFDGRITPQLIVTKHPLVVAAFIIAVILLLLMVFRLMLPRGRTAAETPEA